MFGRTAVERIRGIRSRSGFGSDEASIFFYYIHEVVLYERDGRATVKEKTVLEAYEGKRELVQEFNLISDLFAGKVFEDIDACRELCGILLRDRTIILQSVRTQYVIRNLETHSMELDILAERDNGDVIGVEIQMYGEDAPLKRTRYYLSGIDMSILEKGRDYAELPGVTMVYLTKEDFIGNGRGYYLIERSTDDGKNPAGTFRLEKEVVKVSNGIEERYYNLEHPTGDKQIDELLAYFTNSDPYYKTETFPRIVERVKYFKVHKEGVNIMCAIADRIREEGKSVGRLESRIEDILELLEEFGKVPKRITERINEQDSMEVLRRWHKSAARAASIAEFEANM